MMTNHTRPGHLVTSTRVSRRIFRFAVLAQVCWLMMCFCGPIRAQEVTGTILGTVTDPTNSASEIRVPLASGDLARGRST